MCIAIYAVQKNKQNKNVEGNSIMAGMLECATFSLYVYRDQDQPPLPDGWSVLLDCPSELQHEGYYGIAFINATTVAGETFYDVVIAHRGTVITKDDIWNDVEIFLGWIPDQFSKGAYLFDEYVRQYMQQTYPDPIPSPDINYSITHTGHSLGAALAELCVASSVRFMTSNEPATGMTFESPGSKPIIVDMESKGELPVGALLWAQNNVLTTLADVDAVNTCNEQVASQSYSIGATPIGYDYAADSTDAGIMPPGITLYFANYTISDQHKMVKMYQYWRESEEYEFVKKESAQDTPWPIGLENGYMCYSNYDLRQYYWDGYIQYIWDNHPEIHQEYNNDPSQWSLFFRSNLISSQPKSANFAFFKVRTDEPVATKKEEAASTDVVSRWCVAS